MSRLPGFWRFAWLFWMQPVTLHRLLKSLEIDPGEPAWKLVQKPRSAAVDGWLTRSAQLGLCIVVIIAAFGGFVVGFINIGVHVQLAVGALWASFGFLLGAASDVACGVFRGRVIGAQASGTLGVVTRILVLLATSARLPLFALECVIQTAARFWNSTTSRSSLAWAPVLHHELSRLPHPFLASHLLAEADAQPELARRVLDACSIAPGQRGTGRRVEAKLRARELESLARAKDFEAIQELRGVWLPGLQGADPLLLSFSEAARYLAAARAAFNPHHQLKHLQGFDAQARAIENQLRADRNVLTQPFEEPIRLLRNAGAAMRAEATTNAAGLILNPFRAGNPLSDEEGPELFRGRDTAIREIENILADPRRTASLLLLAPRRAGKTSLLKMLPRMIPDTVSVFFDLQAHPVSSVAAFWIKLAEQASIQARRDRRVELPGLPQGPPIEAAAQWLEQLDHLPDGRRVLIAIDEFERLEDLFPGSRHEFLQLMGLFRATIQHRTGVRLLVSGAAPFDELDRVWDDHFISARQIKLPFLDRPTSIGLLTQPSLDFPAGAISEEAAHAAYERTGGQPFLLQVFGSLLVARLNDEKRKTALAADVSAIEERAMEWAESYFRDMYKSAPPPARAALDRLSQGQPSELTPAARRWLTQRYLLTADDQLAVPIFGAWIEQHALV